MNDVVKCLDQNQNNAMRASYRSQLPAYSIPVRARCCVPKDNPIARVFIINTAIRTSCETQTDERSLIRRSGKADDNPQKKQHCNARHLCPETYAYLPLHTESMEMTNPPPTPTRNKEDPQSGDRLIKTRHGQPQPHLLCLRCCTINE